MEREIIDDPREPDPQWEAAIRGDKEALSLEMEYIAGLVDTINHKAEVLQRTTHELRTGLERHASTDKRYDPETKEFVSGGLRVPSGIRDQCDNPPTTQQ